MLWPAKKQATIRAPAAGGGCGATVGEILTEEFIQPMELTQGALGHAMGVPRKHINALSIARTPRDSQNGARAGT